MIRILIIGDVFAKVGRRILMAELEGLVDREQVDFCIVNIENSAGGFGITPAILAELDDLPIDVFTTGNHVWDKKEGVACLDGHPALLRPANYPSGVPGRGWCLERTAAGVPVAVINLQGTVFMAPIDNPFTRINEVIEEIRESNPEVKLSIVDFHAEATSEKQAMGWHLDGRVSGIFGTHTHVPTADERILPGGTAFQTDLGMTGPYASVIGVKPEGALHRFRTQTPHPFTPAAGDVQLRGCLIEADPETGRAHSIRRITVREDE